MDKDIYVNKITTYMLYTFPIKRTTPLGIKSDEIEIRFISV
jgi:hypothetical protein